MITQVAGGEPDMVRHGITGAKHRNADIYMTICTKNYQEEKPCTVTDNFSNNYIVQLGLGLKLNTKIQIPPTTHHHPHSYFSEAPGPRRRLRFDM